MADSEHYEALIVGGGKAGKTLAADLAKSGVRVALVERGWIGGTCINVGCIPSKALIKAAAVAETVAHAKRFGIDASAGGTDQSAVRVYKRAVVAGMVELNWNNLHGPLGGNFIIGEARFVAPRTVEVRPSDGGALRRLSADKLFINLGASPLLPSIPGLVEVQPLTSESALELDRLPEHLIILGGGYIALELGQAFRRFGSKVTILQRAARLVPGEDPDVSDAIAGILREDGIDVRLSTEAIEAAGKSADRVEVRARSADGEQTIAGTDLLAAAGRGPMTRGIGLEAAGVELDANGFVRVNDRLETTAPGTWALGDCAGSPQHTHVSLDDYRIVKENVFAGGSRSTAGRLIPHTIFIDPELGRVGLTEAEARTQGLAIKVAKVPMAVVPRAQTRGETRGFMKAVVDAQNARILGFAMLGAEAGEVTTAVQMAMLGGLPYTALRDGILAHPTMSEGLNYLFGAVAK